MPKETTSRSTVERDPRTLTPLDWAGVALVAVALLLAPLCAGMFATPPDNPEFEPPSGLLMWLQALGSPIIVIVIALALIVTVWREWKRPVAIGAVPFLTGASLLLAAWAGLSLARIPALYLGLNGLMALLAALAAAGMAARLSRDRNGFTSLLLAVIVAGTLTAVIGIMQYRDEFRSGAAFYRTSATFLNPDFLAGYLLLTIPITLAAFVAAIESLPRIGLGFALVLQSACLLLTGSRAGAGALLLGLAVWCALCIWSGAAHGRGRRIGMAVVLGLLGAILASAPTRSRLAAPAPLPAAAPKSAPKNTTSHDFTSVQQGVPSQSQSLLFRRYTWQGTVAMIKANPVIGTGIGSFEIAYPRYAITAYTAHAHNSLLQWTGDTGIPGALLLLTVFAAVTAFAINVLRLRRITLVDHPNDPAPRYGGAFEEPSLLLAGLLSALVASAIKTFFDSDWFIVATLLTLAVSLALLVALARDVAPLATQTPRPLSRDMLAGCLVVAALLLWRAAGTGMERLDIVQGNQALQDRQAQAALDAYRDAASADPFDPEVRLDLASLYGSMDRPDLERTTLQAAIKAAPTAKAYYRLGQHYRQAGDLEQAIAAFRLARARQPKNLQTLHRLAESLDKFGRTDEAVSVYRSMADLQTEPFGTVQAIGDERVETEFAYAHAGLADIAARRQQWAEAAQEYEQAAAVMRAYWVRRNWLTYIGMAPQKRQELFTLYQSVLQGWREALQKQGADPALIDRVAEIQKDMEADYQHDQEKQAQMTGNGARE